MATVCLGLDACLYRDKLNEMFVQKLGLWTWWWLCGRRWTLERKIADGDVSPEDEQNLLKELERKETEYMRLQRHKMGVDDFELLTIIGRGAFGEVYTVASCWINHLCKLLHVFADGQLYFLSWDIFSV